MATQKKTVLEHLKNIGPGALVSAAFIGPGTVTTCIRSGVQNQYMFLWAMLFSTLATIVLQEMASRLGILTHKGLGENIRSEITNPIFRAVSAIIVITAILIGNAAYETGNFTGSIMGLQIMFPEFPIKPAVALIALFVGILLWTGQHRKIENFLIGTVIVMTVVFSITAVVIKPDWKLILRGMFIPSFGNNGLMTIVGLIGTTIVPYNLFLHASTAAKRWDKEEDIKTSRIDSVVAIGLGGLISMFIIIVAATLYDPQNPKSIANALEFSKTIGPVWGVWTKWFIGVGLLAAGLSSSITAPLAAAYATNGITGMDKGISDIKFKMIWLPVVLVGGTLAIVLGKSPTELILVAQAANAIVLPLIAFFVIYCVNSPKLGKYRNNALNNVLALIVIVVTCLLFFRNISSFWASLKALIGQ